jgi:hypothetical protein
MGFAMSFRDLLDFAPQAAAIFNDYPVAASVLSGLVLLALGFLAGWWLRGAVDASEIRRLNVETQGLKKEINELRIQLGVRDGRLESAKQKDETLTRAVEQAKADFERLNEQIRSSATPALISKTAKSTAQAIEQITAANSALRSTLRVRWLRH